MTWAANPSEFLDPFAIYSLQFQISSRLTPASTPAPLAQGRLAGNVKETRGSWTQGGVKELVVLARSGKCERFKPESRRRTALAATHPFDPSSEFRVK